MVFLTPANPTPQDTPPPLDRTTTAIEWASGTTAVAMFAYGVSLSYSVLYRIAAAGLPPWAAHLWPLGFEAFMASAALKRLAEQRGRRHLADWWQRVPWYPWTLTAATAGGSIRLNWFHPAPSRWTPRRPGCDTSCTACHPWRRCSPGGGVRLAPVPPAHRPPPPPPAAAGQAGHRLARAARRAGHRLVRPPRRGPGAAGPRDPHVSGDRPPRPTGDRPVPLPRLRRPAPAPRRDSRQQRAGHPAGAGGTPMSARPHGLPVTRSPPARPGPAGPLARPRPAPPGDQRSNHAATIPPPAPAGQTASGDPLHPRGPRRLACPRRSWRWTPSPRCTPPPPSRSSSPSPAWQPARSSPSSRWSPRRSPPWPPSSAWSPSPASAWASPPSCSADARPHRRADRNELWPMTSAPPRPGAVLEAS